MSDEGKQKLKYWLIGLFTGGFIATPITAVICKNIYEKKIEVAADQAETRGMNAMAEYAVQQQTQQNIDPKDIYTPDVAKRQDRPLTEEDYTEKDPREYDLGIPEEDRDPEQEEITYLGMTEQYRNDDTNKPYVISSEEFETNHRYEKSFINWYSKDNIFEENLNKIDDPYFTFGVTNGGELFKDSNLCYLRNPRADVSTDFEITRIIGSYAEIVGGERALGETDT